MYKRITYLLSFILLFFICSVTIVDAQHNNVKNLKPGYHVVVGSFKIHDNAKRYTELLLKKGMSALYGFNEKNEMYYVTTRWTSSLNVAIQEVLQTRHDTAFYDAWVKSIGEFPSPDTLQQPVQEDASILFPSKDSVFLETHPEEEITLNNQITLENTEVFLSLFNAMNNRVIEGRVKVVDAKSNKLITEVEGNKYLLLPASLLKGSEKLILICEITGFRKVQREIDYTDPLKKNGNSDVELFGTTVLVNFEMVPYVKGDIVTLYNVYFYNDAAVMQPESQFELNQVLQMMQDNPDQRIRLHGHTNGNSSGPIISKGADRDYFSLQNARKGFGTARELAEQRAQIIKEYLVDNSIDKSRIEIKSWGGRRPLFDKHSARAKMNVRVEVEVL